MFNTLVAVIALLVFVLPGFIVNELASSRRATAASGSDLDTALRSLWYSVVVHLLLAATGWTLTIVRKVDGNGEWEEHVGAVALFVAVAVLLLPTLVGGVLGSHLRRAEQRGNLTTLDYALGGRDGRSAWDYLFGHLPQGFVILHLERLPSLIIDNADDAASAPPQWRTIIGQISDQSWASQSPAQVHDLWLPAIWPGDEHGNLIGNFRTERGLWVSSDQIVSMQVIQAPDSRANTSRTNPPEEDQLLLRIVMSLWRGKRSERE